MLEIHVDAPPLPMGWQSSRWTSCIVRGFLKTFTSVFIFLKEEKTEFDSGGDMSRIWGIDGKIIRVEEITEIVEEIRVNDFLGAH